MSLARHDMVSSNSAGKARTARGVFLLIIVELIALGASLKLVPDILVYPYQLDYGEGVVWQQAKMILRGDGYAPLAMQPFIVFHYPPVYHLVAGTTALLVGDFLVAGRLVSLGAALGSVVLLGAIIFHAAARAPSTSRWHVLAVALLVALFFLNQPPVAEWSMFARVDMLALFFGFLGAWLCLKVPKRPALVAAAAGCFALSLFTKQSYVALPAAGLTTLLFASPRLGVRAILTTAAIGLTTMILLQAVTAGEFLKHVVSYNINRFDVPAPSILLQALAAIALVVVIGATSASMLFGTVRRRGGRLPAVVRTDRFEQAWLFSLLFLFFTTLLLPLALKKGASNNYFIEWLAAVSLLIGLHLVRLVEEGRRIWPLYAIALTISSLVILAKLPARFLPSEDMDELYARIHAAAGPLISDEMVMVIRSGKEVLWESAIHRELDALGRWDPRPLASRIRGGEFPLIVTLADLEDAYPPAIVEAIREAHPVTIEYGAYVAHVREDAEP